MKNISGGFYFTSCLNQGYITLFGLGVPPSRIFEGVVSYTKFSE